MTSALQAKADGSLPLEFFHDLLEEHFSEDEVRTAARYGHSVGPLCGTVRLRLRTKKRLTLAKP